MPSHSEKQALFMKAIAHNAKFAQTVGVPQSVGHEYADADTAAKHAALLHALGHYSVGGAVQQQQAAPGMNLGTDGADNQGGDTGPQLPGDKWGLGGNNYENHHNNVFGDAWSWAQQGANNFGRWVGGIFQPNAAAPKVEDNALNNSLHAGDAPAQAQAQAPGGPGSGQQPGLFGFGQFNPADVSSLPGYGDWQQQLNQRMGMAAPQLATGPQDATRSQQGALADMLMRQAQGQGPSVAQQQLAQTTQGNIASAYALAQGRPNDAGSARNIANQVGNLNQQAAQQGALLRAQEQLGAMGQLGGTLGNMRGQDIDVAGRNLNAQGQYNDNQARLLGLGLTGAQDQHQAALDYQALLAGQYNAAAGRETQVEAAGMQAAGSVAAAAMNHAKGGPIYPLQAGGGVPGHASVAGDSEANDTVPAMLSPGEVVLPRHVTQAPDAPDRARAFMEAVQKSQAKPPTFADVLASRRKAQHFAGGGGVADYLPNPVVAPMDAADPSQLEDLHKQNTMDKAGLLFGYDDVSPMLSASPASIPSAQQVGNGATPSDIPSRSAADALGATRVGEYMAGNYDATGKPEKAKEAEGEGKPKEKDALAEAIAKASATPAPMPTAGGSSTAGLERQLLDAAKAKGAAEDEAAKVAGDFGKEKQAKQEAEATQLQALSQKRDAQFQAYQKRADETAQAIASSKIDPNHFWASRSTGQKIAGAIALALGGFAQAFTGQNPAQAIIDKAIDRDIEAQKENLGKQQSLLSHYVQQGHSVQEAAQLAKADLKDYTAAQLDASASKYAGPEAQAMAKQQRAETQQKTTMERAQLRAQAGEADLRKLQVQGEALKIQEMQREARLRPVVEAINNASATGKVLPEGARTYMDPKRTVNVPGHGVTYANTEKDRDEVADTQQALHAGLAAVKRLKELSGKTGLGGNDSQLGQLAVVDAQNAYQSILGRSNAPRGEQEKQLEAALSNPTTLFKTSDSIKAQAAALEKILRKHAAAVYGARLVGGLEAAKGLVNTEAKEE